MLGKRKLPSPAKQLLSLGEKPIKPWRRRAYEAMIVLPYGCLTLSFLGIALLVLATYLASWK